MPPFEGYPLGAVFYDAAKYGFIALDTIPADTAWDWLKKKTPDSRIYEDRTVKREFDNPERNWENNLAIVISTDSELGVLALQKTGKVVQIMQLVPAPPPPKP